MYFSLQFLLNEFYFTFKYLHLLMSVSTFEVPTCSFEGIEDGYGTIIGVETANKNEGLKIPFYSKTVIEGKNLDFNVVFQLHAVQQKFF